MAPAPVRAAACVAAVQPGPRRPQVSSKICRCGDRVRGRVGARPFAAALGLAAGLWLLQRKPGAVTIARASLIVSAAVDILVYATPWYPNNRPPGDATLILAGSLAYYAAWLAYLARSKRVVAIYEP